MADPAADPAAFDPLQMLLAASQSGALGKGWGDFMNWLTQTPIAPTSPLGGSLDKFPSGSSVMNAFQQFWNWNPLQPVAAATPAAPSGGGGGSSRWPRWCLGQSFSRLTVIASRALMSAGEPKKLCAGRRRNA